MRFEHSDSRHDDFVMFSLNEKRYINISNSMYDTMANESKTIFGISAININGEISVELVDQDNTDNKENDEKKTDDNVAEFYLEFWFPIRLQDPRNMSSFVFVVFFFVCAHFFAFFFGYILIDITPFDLSTIRQSNEFIHSAIRSRKHFISINSNKLSLTWNVESEPVLSNFFCLLWNYPSNPKYITQYCANNNILIFLVVQNLSENTLIFKSIESSIKYQPQPIGYPFMRDIELNTNRNKSQWKEKFDITLNTPNINNLKLNVPLNRNKSRWKEKFDITTNAPNINNLKSNLPLKRKTEEKKIKILFLSTGVSGRATFFKSLRLSMGDGYIEKGRLAWKDHIYSQVIEQMKSLVDAMEELKEDEPDDFGHLELSATGEKAAEFIDIVRSNIDVNEDVANNISILWKEAAILEVFEERARLRIDDS